MVSLVSIVFILIFSFSTAHKKHMGGDGMSTIHDLFASRSQISRIVKNLDNGVETWVESENETIAESIQSHVTYMSGRVKNNEPVHQMDPLFVELFERVNWIEFWYENTSKGVHVKETSTDSCTALIIQAHAHVVSLFIQNGMQEAMQSHEVPSCALNKDVASSFLKDSNRTVIILSSSITTVVCIVVIGAAIFIFMRRKHTERPFQQMKL